MMNLPFEFLHIHDHKCIKIEGKNKDPWTIQSSDGDLEQFSNVCRKTSSKF